MSNPRRDSMDENADEPLKYRRKLYRDILVLKANVSVQVARMQRDPNLKDQMDILKDKLDEGEKALSDAFAQRQRAKGALHSMDLGARVFHGITNPIGFAKGLVSGWDDFGERPSSARVVGNAVHEDLATRMKFDRAYSNLASIIKDTQTTIEKLSKLTDKNEIEKSTDGPRPKF